MSQWTHRQMRTSQSEQRGLRETGSSGGLRLVLGVAVALTGLGVVLRFAYLGHHFYFHDEAETSLRISGYTAATFNQFVAGHTVTVAQIRRFQAPSRLGLLDTVHSLALNDPQHPPLFFVAAHVWARLFGASIVSVRSLSALFGVLALACAGWLMRELGGSARAAWVAVGLVAISPFEFLYSQEAREYSLWVAAVAASSAALLRALRTMSGRTWAFYAFLLGAALYAFPLSALVALGHAIFVLLDPRRRAKLRRFLGASAGAAVLFLPWVGEMILQRGALRAGTSWTGSPVPFSSLFHSWLVVFSLGVLDKSGASPLNDGWIAAFVVVIAVEAGALVMLFRIAPRSTWQFVVCLAGATVLPLMIADLTVGGVRSTIPRYIAPTYLALTIGLAFVLSEGLVASRTRIRLLTAVIGLAIVAAGVGSYVESAPAKVWWNQDDGAAAENLAVSIYVNRQQRPLLISTAPGTLLEMSHYLRPTIPVRVLLSGRLRQLPTRSTTVVLYGSPADERAATALASLVREIRRRGLSVRPLVLPLPCCGDAIHAIPHQAWLLEGNTQRSRSVGLVRPHPGQAGGVGGLPVRVFVGREGRHRRPPSRAGSAPSLLRKGHVGRLRPPRQSSSFPPEPALPLTYIRPAKRLHRSTKLRARGAIRRSRVTKRSREGGDRFVVVLAYNPSRQWRAGTADRRMSGQTERRPLVAAAPMGTLAVTAASTAGMSSGRSAGGGFGEGGSSQQSVRLIRSRTRGRSRAARREPSPTRGSKEPYPFASAKQSTRDHPARLALKRLDLGKLVGSTASAPHSFRLLPRVGADLSRRQEVSASGPAGVGPLVVTAKTR
jgi:uncharacterized membrane protein